MHLPDCNRRKHGGKSTGKWEYIFQSGNFEQTGKVREIYPKCWISDGILPKILEKEILARFYFFL